MAEVERDGDDILIRMNVNELEELSNILEKTGNSSCRERNRYPEDSIMYKFRLTLAQAAWDWAENLSVMLKYSRGTLSHTFKVKIK